MRHVFVTLRIITPAPGLRMYRESIPLSGGNESASKLSVL